MSLVVFMAHLRALLRRTYLASSTEIVVDGISLNPVRRLCRFGEQEVRLSGREVEVLAGLMAADGAVIAKQDLLRQVWGNEFKGDDNIVEVYIRHLRTKLKSFERIWWRQFPVKGIDSACLRDSESRGPGPLPPLPDYLLGNAGGRRSAVRCRHHRRACGR